MSQPETFHPETDEKFEIDALLAENEMMSLGSFNFSLLLIFFVFSVTSEARVIAPPGKPTSSLTGYWMSYESQAGRTCMEKQVSGGEADKILNRYGAHVEGSQSEAFSKGTATALSRIADLGRADLVQGITFKLYPDGRGRKKDGSLNCASYTAPTTLSIVAGNGACNRNVDSTQIGMHILHEMGHSIGLRLKLYGSYLSHKCDISGYCTHNDSKPGSESFAESFAMYVHSPAELKAKCPDTYDFIKKNVFNDRDSTAGICQGLSPAIAGPDSGAPGGDGSLASNGTGGTGQIMQLAQMLAPLINKEKDKSPAAAAPALQVIPATAPGPQCNLSSGKCGGDEATR